MIVATAGHVDHGKTSLVNALTGIDTDRLAEEKKRGLTIDLGFAYTDTETGSRLGFVDVPGHIRFINNMLAGVSAIDCALLVIAADDGVMPQTAEHLEILNLLGIDQGLIALTKIDRCDDTQIKDTIKTIEQAVNGTFLENAEIFPVSSETGEGIDMMRVALEVTAEEITARSDGGLFRLAIDRRFTVKGAGIVVTGSVFAGQINVGDEAYLMPQGIPVRIRSLHTQNQEATSAQAGDRCAVNLTSNDLELEDIHRGNWLTTNRGAATSRADVRLTLSSSETRPLSHWTPVHVHAAANHAVGRVALLEARKIAPGEDGLIQVVFSPAINLCVGDRIIIRDQAAARTLGGGIVLNPHSPARGRARQERVANLKQLSSAAPENACMTMISAANMGLSKTQLQQDFNLSEQELTNTLKTNIRLLDDNWLITPSHFDRCCVTLTERVTHWHEQNPGKGGMPKSQMRALVRSWPGPLFDAVIPALIESGNLEQQGNQLKRPGYGVQLSSQEQKIWVQVEPLLAADPTKPPVLHDLAKSVSTEPRILEKILIQVVKTGQLVRPVKNRFFLKAGIAQLRRALAEVDGPGGFSVQAYRDETGIGRNLCIEILEYFDRQGVTRRIGDARQLIKKDT